MSRWLPILQGLLPVPLSQLPSDAIAGATLAALAIPEVMGYTRLAGTPVVTGLYTLLLPMALFAVFEWRALKGRGPDASPFAWAIGLFLLSYVGIAISLWPMIVPFHYTIWQAASSESTQAFLLIGTLFLLPIILGYTAWSYWVFRGKVRGEIGYH